MSWLWGGSADASKEAPPGEPTKTEMKSITLTETFPKMSTKDTFDIVFGKELIIAYQESQGNKDVQVSDWKDISTDEDKAAGVQRMERSLRYTVPMNVPLPKMMADSIGMTDTIANAVETCTVKDGVYTVTATCELTGPPMCNKVDIRPLFTVKPSPEDPADGFVEVIIQFSFNVWGLASMVETTMEAGVQKGFVDLLTMAKKISTDGPPAKK